MSDPRSADRGPVPARVWEEIGRSLRRAGHSGDLVGARSVGGGSINAAARVEASDGSAFFLKWNAGVGAEFFQVEADGLLALRSADSGGLAVPEPIALGRGEGEAVPWLLMPFLDRGAAGGGWEESLGRGMAELHGRPPPEFLERYGWHADNVIGSLHQSNPPTEDWAEFWRDHRIVPQLTEARAQGWFDGASGTPMDRLVDRMEEALTGTEDDGPALLHGDLWGGNVFGISDGRAAIVDPAVYVGHHEVDLAMSELFGFPSRFMPAYREARPVAPEYDEFRRDLYQLYYLLVHVNLFGGGYVRGSTAAAERVLAAMG